MRERACAQVATRKLLPRAEVTVAAIGKPQARFATTANRAPRANTVTAAKGAPERVEVATAPRREKPWAEVATAAKTRLRAKIVTVTNKLLQA